MAVSNARRERKAPCAVSIFFTFWQALILNPYKLASLLSPKPRTQKPRILMPQTSLRVNAERPTRGSWFFGLIERLWKPQRAGGGRSDLVAIGVVYLWVFWLLDFGGLCVKRWHCGILLGQSDSGPCFRGATALNHGVLYIYIYIYEGMPGLGLLWGDVRAGGVTLPCDGFNV